MAADGNEKKTPHKMLSNAHVHGKLLRKGTIAYLTGEMAEVLVDKKLAEPVKAKKSPAPAEN